MWVSILGILCRNHCFSWLNRREASSLSPCQGILMIQDQSDPAQHIGRHTSTLLDTKSIVCNLQSDVARNCLSLLLLQLIHLLCSSRYMAPLAWAIYIPLSELKNKRHSQDTISSNPVRETFSHVRQCLTMCTLKSPALSWMFGFTAIPSCAQRIAIQKTRRVESNSLLPSQATPLLHETVYLYAFCMAHI